MARFRVTVSPGASRTELVGRHGDGWKARIAAPPERGRANDALRALLSGALGVPREAVRIVGGAGSRSKVVDVEGIDAAELELRLTRAVQS